MKNFTKIIYLLLSITILTGCGEDALNNDSTKTSTSKNDFAIINRLGLDTTTIVDKGNYYLVEGDIAIMKNKISEYLNGSNSQPITRQAQTSSVVSSTNVMNINVKVDESLSSLSNWADAITEAISIYNSTPTTIKFTEVSSNYDLLITKDLTLDPSILGEGTFPANGKVGDLVRINADSEYNALDLSQKVFLLVHEIGHNLGLRHTNWSGRGEKETGIGIPGTPNSGSNPDPSSVMNGDTGGHYWSGFSEYDLVALEKLYPLEITHSSTNNVSDSTLVTYSTSNKAPTWKAIENATLVSGQGTPNAIFRLTGNGTAKVSAAYSCSGYSFVLYDSSIFVGKPLVPTIITSSIYYANCSYDVDALPETPGSTYTWRVSGAKITESSDSQISIKVGNYYNDATAKISLTVTNQLGSIQVTKTIPIKGSQGKSGPEI